MASTAVVYRLIARDNASRVFNNVGRSARNLQTTSERVGAAMKKGLTIGAVATAGLGASVVQMAGDFEKNMNRVEALSGATGSQLKKLRDQAKDLGRSTQYSASQSADAMAQLATAGLNVNQIYGSMPSVLALASSEQLDLTRAAEISTSVMTGYGMTVKQMPHAIDAMVKASVKANTSVDDLGEAFKYAGPIAHQAGLRFEETVASMALMGNAGIKASMAGTALRGAVTRLLAPTDKVKGVLEDLGVKVSTAGGKLLPLNKIVKELGDKGATTGQIMTIFGQRAGPGMAALIQQGSDKLVSLTGQLEKSGGTADRISKIQMKGWRGEVTRLKNAWEGLMIAIGDSGVLSVATKALSGVTKATTVFADWVNDHAIPAAKGFKRVMGDLIPVGEIKDGISTAKSAVTDFLRGFSGTKKAASDLIGGFLDTSPHLGSGKTQPGKPGKPLELMPHYGVGQVAPSTGVQMPRLQPMPHGGSGMIAPLISPKAKPPKSAAEKLGEMIRKSISDGFSHIDWGKLGSTLGRGLGDAIGWVGKHTADFTKKIAGIFAKLDFVQIGKGFGAAALPLAIGFITNLFAPLFSLDFWKKHWLDTIIAVVSVIPIGRIAGVLGKLFEHIPILKIFEPLLRGISKLGGWVEKGFGKYVLRPVGRFGKAVWDGIVGGFTRVFPGAVGKLDDFIGKMALNVLGYTGRFAAAGERLIRGLGNGILKIGGRIGDWIGRIVGWLLKPFAKAGGWLFGRGKAVVVGLKNGVVSIAKTIGSWTQQHVIAPVTSRFSRAGSWLVSKGRALVSGLKSGIVEVAKSISRWTGDHVVTPMLNRFSSAGSWLVTKGRSLVGGLKSGIVSIAKSIGSWTTSHVSRPVINAFKNSGNWLVSKGGALVSGLKSGIVNAVKGIGSWIKSHIVDPVVGAVKRFFGIHSPSRVFMGIGGHLVSGLMKGMAKTSGTAIAKKVFGSLPKALAAIAKKGLVSIASLPGKALKALGGLGSSLLGALGLGGGGSNAGQWKATVKTVLEMLGAPASALGPVLKRIGMESGGNPDAINRWDSNAKAGHPSQGLMQTIPSTFNAYSGPFRSRGITDPLANIYAGVNYAMHRYGSNWISVMTRPGGYAKGTSGAAPGLAWVGERGPELVNFKGGEDILSHSQSMQFAKANGIKLPGYASGTINNAADRVRRDRQRVEDAKDAVARAKRRHKGVAAAEKRLRAAETELRAAKISLRNAQRSAKTSIANTIATGLQKTLSTGTSSAIASAIKSLATKLLNAGYTKTAASIQKKGGRLESLANKKASIQKSIAAANQYASDQASNITDFLSVSGTSATNVRDLIGQATSQQKTASSFVTLSKSLKARGASKALLQQLSDAGPGSQLATILGDRKVTTNDIKKLNSLMASGGKLATSFGKDMADLMYDSGKDAGKGFLAGLKAQEAALGKQMAKLAADLVKQIKKILKIKSPSGVFRDEVGKNVVLGMVHGIDAHSHLVGAATQRLADTATGVSMRRRYVPTAANGGSQARQEATWERLAVALEAAGSEVHVHFNDDRLRELIDVQVKPKIKTSEDRQAYRAKVGRR